MTKNQEQSWPASKVELWPVDKITPYDKNPRTHPQAQIDLIAKSMVDDGVTAPILVDEKGVIIYGHGRRLAAIQNKFKKYPVAVAKGWTAKQKNAARIKDNSYGLMSGWDDGLMQAALTQLKLEEYPLELLGFPERELLAFGISSGTDSDQDPEAVPEIPKKPIVRKGDLWVLGEHRLLCGDSTKAEDVARLMDGAKARLMNTDPPYGIAYDSSAIHAHGIDYGEIEGDDQLDGAKLQTFLESVIRTSVPHLADNAAFYLWHPMLTQGAFFAAAAAAADIFIHRQIIWIKPVLVFGRGDYHWKHELCFYGWRRGHRPKFYGERNQTTVWEVDSVSHSERKEFAHATPKPVELFVRPLKNHTKKNDVCYEPFAGTGPQIIAAEMTGRVCRAIEIAPQYVEVSILRWQTFTGKLATLDGKTLEQVAKARRSGRAKGKTHETGDLGKPISRPDGARDGKKHPVRKGGNARRTPARGFANSEPPTVARDS